MALLYNNICYSDETDLLNAFNMQFPKFQTYGVNQDLHSLQSSRVKLSGNTIFYSLNDEQGNTVLNSQLDVQECDINKIQTPDTQLIIISFWFALIIGLICGAAYVSRIRA